MGMTCLTVCPECNRHLRCERACPFCGARISSGLRVLEYRIKTRLSRANAFSLGASLTLAGFVSSCEQSGGPAYGAPCNPPSCSPITGGNAGAATAGGNPNVAGAGGSPNGGVAGSGLAGGGTAGGSGSSPAMAGAGGDATPGAGADGGAAGAGDLGGAGGDAP